LEFIGISPKEKNPEVFISDSYKARAENILAGQAPVKAHYRRNIRRRGASWGKTLRISTGRR